MTNVFEEFQKQLRDAALKKQKKKEAEKVVNPKASKDFKAPYITKFKHIDDYWA